MLDWWKYLEVDKISSYAMNMANYSLNKASIKACSGEFD